VPDTIEEMVSDRLADLLAIQSRGPYRLGGYCHGGVFAYEMARRLVAMGHRVDALVLVEATYSAPFARALRRVDRLVAAFGTSESRRDQVRRGKSLLRRMRRRLDDAVALRDRGRRVQLRFLSEVLSRRLRARSRPRDSPQDRLGPLYLRYQAALESYVPGGYAGRLVVLRAAEARVGDRTVPLAGWGPFADDVEVLTVPGDHHTCVTAHARQLAAVLRRFL
jgi:thioesterase domain-containing protein